MRSTRADLTVASFLVGFPASASVEVRVGGMEKVGVVGAGLMGSGIAEVHARAGADVMLTEVSRPALDAGRARLEKSLRAWRAQRETDRGGRRGGTEAGTFTTDLGRVRRS